MRFLVRESQKALFLLCLVFAAIIFLLAWNDLLKQALLRADVRVFPEMGIILTASLTTAFIVYLRKRLRRLSR
jgi:hypothetical protein